MIKDGRKYRFITDHRGSVRMVVDTHTGTVMQRTDYDEFGFIIDEDLAENWTPVLFGYAGGLQDRDTGLIRFGARDYDPMVGRWTSKEPLGFNGSSNFYVYAENDPVNYVDVNGLWIDTFIDVMAIGIDMLNIAQDIYKLITRDPSDCPEDFEDVDLMGNLTSLSLNVLSAMLPGVIAMGHVKDLSKVTHKHHLLPKQFKEFFKKAGLNIEDFKIPISGDKHIMKGGVHPKGWNKDWDKFIKSNDPNPEKILDYMNKMRKKYNI
jgi:RHS repeat-associated protein